MNNEINNIENTTPTENTVTTEEVVSTSSGATLTTPTPSDVITTPIEEVPVEEKKDKPNLFIIFIIVLVFVIGAFLIFYMLINLRLNDETNNNNITSSTTKEVSEETTISTEVTTKEVITTTELVTEPITTKVVSNKRVPSSKDQSALKAMIDKDFPLADKSSTEYQINGSLTEQQLYDNFVASWKAYDSDSFKWGTGSVDYSVITLKADVLDCTDNVYDTELYKSNTTGKIDKIRVFGNNEEYIITIK